MPRARASPEDYTAQKASRSEGCHAEPATSANYFFLSYIAVSWSNARANVQRKKEPTKKTNPIESSFA
eukprot:2971725-Amphidinium_carterae.1